MLADVERQTEQIGHKNNALCLRSIQHHSIAQQAKDITISLLHVVTKKELMVQCEFIG